MSWQDIVISIGQFLFLIALIPSIRSEHKPAFGTSLMTALVLTAFGITYGTLGLWFAVSTSVFISAGWYILAWQTYKEHKKHVD
ncbi:MAG: hypothetical protein COV34_03430 [Candidatus Zambryskibacteria bacterium CG10_big_fil_rev_8_21_14_0_10_42_12]|uniref:Uncharacterized protein n=1 Tax=Candidatus Zambryskibacteria bacterium CG10_big_fil_rev_8_21_14_0_10_42_12 TaxID=1975115 RepID=A0A2H0QSK1_9BACT|nr:MAG: hypothetical protein COV34_03430 [Candidatus Zambryskibacteria bacterium CG10_big_fil_rev_8_21_14_0_10_42_12]